MDWWLYVIIGVAGAFALLILVLLIRTLAFNPKKTVIAPGEPVDFDKEKAVKDLQDMVKLRTVSSRDKEEEEGDQFDQFDKPPLTWVSTTEYCCCHVDTSLLLK